MTITRLGERLYMVEDTPMISPTDIETRAAIEFLRRRVRQLNPRSRHGLRTEEEIQHRYTAAPRPHISGDP